MILLSRYQLIRLVALVLIVAAICLLRFLIDRHPTTGEISIAWPEASYASYRLTALAAGAVVGVSLAIAGVLLQALLRNPLAEPFILGLSSGAGLGVMIAMYVGHVTQSAMLTTGANTLPAILGALLTLGVVYALGQSRGWLDPVSLVLIGVVVSTICGAGIMFFQHLVPTGLRGQFTTWLMGHIPESIDGQTLGIAAAVASIGLIAGACLGRAMDAATLGDDEARSIGLSIGPVRVIVFILAGVLAAISVALAGPIGFVGLVAPHVGRLLLGPRHGVLVVGAAMLGIVMVVGSDIARQAIDVGAGRMPIGIFTAILGGPVFIWLLISGRGQS
jgi:iron complex transport system permease protein